MSTPLTLILRAVAVWSAWPWLSANGLLLATILVLVAGLIDELARSFFRE